MPFYLKKVNTRKVPKVCIFSNLNVIMFTFPFLFFLHFSAAGYHIQWHVHAGCLTVQYTHKLKQNAMV